jgi:hypothetical protein
MILLKIYSISKLTLMGKVRYQQGCTFFGLASSKFRFEDNTKFYKVWASRLGLRSPNMLVKKGTVLSVQLPTLGLRISRASHAVLRQVTSQAQLGDPKKPTTPHQFESHPAMTMAW